VVRGFAMRGGFGGFGLLLNDFLCLRVLMILKPVLWEGCVSWLLLEWLACLG